MQAAIEVIDQQGEQALTMRSLSARLKVQASTIYTYFDQMGDVEEAVIELRLAAIPMLNAESEMPLHEQLIEHFTAVRAAHILHPKVSPGRIGSVAWRWGLRQIDNVLAQLVAAGMDLEVALVVSAALLGVTVNSAANARELGDEDLVHIQRKVVTGMKGFALPYVMQVMKLPTAQLPAEESFRRLLGILIDRLLGESVRAGKKPTQKSR